MTWTKVAKPISSSSAVFTGGDPIGLLLALTYTTVSNVSADWTKVPKPTTVSWNKVAKPTT